MLHMICTSCHFIMILVVLFYAFLALSSIGFKENKTVRYKRKLQKLLIIMFQLLSLLTLYLKTNEVENIYVLLSLLGLTICYPILIGIVYPQRQRFLENHLLFFFSVGIVILCRLNENMALKQFLIGVLGLAVFSFLPYIILNCNVIEYLGGLYAVLGMGLLSLVFLVGVNLNGASNWIKVAGITIQPSEFVKIIFACCLASLLRENTSFKNIFRVAIISGMHVLILVAEKDLGGAFLFFLVFLFTVFVATNNYFYLFGGMIGVVLIITVFYQMFSDSFFSHVKVRILAWKDPFAYIENEGYQISQSLFGIGTGGFLGFGLGQGIPNKVPYAETDFVFSSICEEMGGIIGICLILVEISFLLSGLNIAMKLKHKFYKFLAIALLLSYQIQVLLNIGGVTKFIPSTGVTLPFISYGGSSLISSIILYYFLQGLTLFYQKEVGNYEKKEKRNQ